MSRVSRALASALIGVLLLASAALAARPIRNGSYVDLPKMFLMVSGTSRIKTVHASCHGNVWSTTHSAAIQSSGRFSYHGSAVGRVGKTGALVGHATMAVGGVFKTSHVAKGIIRVGGCTIHFSAQYGTPA